MPQAPEQYKRSRPEDVEKLEATNRDDNENNRYAHRRYRKFRARILKKQRAQDEMRIHRVYRNLNERSFKDYIFWLQDDKPLCKHCLDKGSIKPGRVLDHIHPIEKGGAVYDSDNLQFLCDHHHNIKSGKEAHHSKQSTVKVISGAPGSGKTTYVKNHVKPGDLVFDLDEIYRALSFQPLYKKPDELKDVVFRVRDRIYRAIREVNEIKRAWVIVSYPDPDKRKSLQKKLQADLFLIDTPADVCKKRIQKQGRPGNVDWNSVVDEWFDRYEPAKDETIIPYAGKA